MQSLRCIDPQRRFGVVLSALDTPFAFPAMEEAAAMEHEADENKMGGPPPDSKLTNNDKKPRLEPPKGDNTSNPSKASGVPE